MMSFRRTVAGVVLSHNTGLGVTGSSVLRGYYNRAKV